MGGELSKYVDLWETHRGVPSAVQLPNCENPLDSTAAADLAVKKPADAIATAMRTVRVSDRSRINLGTLTPGG